MIEIFGLQLWMHGAIIGGSLTLGLSITCLIDWIHQKIIKRKNPE